MDDNQQPQELSSLDKFKQRLDQKGRRLSGLKSTLLSVKNPKINQGWPEDELTSTDYRPIVARKTNLLLWRLFWGSSIFFLATIGVAVYVLFFSANIVSGNNIDILIKGPTQIRSGDELNLQTTIVNKNKVTLNSVNLVLSYPPGTMDPLSANQELPFWREKIDHLNPGQAIDVASRAIIFGGQNTKQEIKVILEYRIPESNALFTKEKVYEVLIGSSSLDLTFKLPSEINIGKEFTGTLKIVSNAQSLLRNCTIQFEWPAGFNFQKAEPPTIDDNKTWFLGDLVPGTEKEINFTGTISGQSGDIKPFRVVAGFAANGGKDPLTLEYGNIFQTINLRRDFVDVGIFVADDGGRDPVISPGGILVGDIGWVNNLNDRIINGIIELKISGAFLNKRMIQASSGFYNSLNDTIVWDERVLSDLKNIPASEGGQVNFRLGLLPLSRVTDSQDKQIKLNLTFRGTRLTGENQTEEVVSQDEKTIKLSTQVDLSGTGSYFVGPFKNIGPLPPTVGQETTYTINLSANSLLNDMVNVKMRTVLPPAVKWLNLSSPLDEKVVYNQTSGEVVWDLGRLETQRGDDSSSRKMSFQVSLLPSLSQAGYSVDLTRTIVFQGQDLFTGANIEKVLPAVSTRLLSDPNFELGQDIVTE